MLAGGVTIAVLAGPAGSEEMRSTVTAVVADFACGRFAFACAGVAMLADLVAVEGSAGVADLAEGMGSV